MKAGEGENLSVRHFLKALDLCVNCLLLCGYATDELIHVCSEWLAVGS